MMHLFCWYEMFEVWFSFIVIIRGEMMQHRVLLLLAFLGVSLITSSG